MLDMNIQLVEYSVVIWLQRPSGQRRLRVMYFFLPSNSSVIFMNLLYMKVIFLHLNVVEPFANISLYTIVYSIECPSA